SIFDLDEGHRQDGADAEAGADGAPFAGLGLARPVHPPIPSEEFDQPALLAAEKEAIGLFVSDHPLKPLREAMRTRVDCPLSALQERRDKDLLTVGGIITEARKIRTRNGDPMMFATLDDLAGSVELLVFGNALADHEQALQVDQVVLVKGRVDHKEAGSTCLIVQSVEPYAPDRQELDRARAKARATAAADAAGARPLHLSVSADCLSAETLAELRQAIEESPGQAEVVLDIHTSSGMRRVRLGSAFRVRHTLSLRADLESALGALPAAVSA
ncbi:MAG TPA: OB-fold nucleic acid binding domain-containing protein, partial [Solirubrobacteraceae bacterium]|nr:OB-fold nucleic acid binding domain-containing protein [Solirubrobacteraceae bacterium]